MTAAMDAEVLVVGAGPAGATLALELARRGRDVLILERSRFPRDKPCGDCVNPGAVAELEALGLAERLSRRLSPRPLRGWCVEAPDGRRFEAAFGEGPEGVTVGWAVRRRDFDAALLKEAIRAGARVRFGVRVFGLLRSGERIAGAVAREGTRVSDLRCAVVAGADGLRSVVQRRLALSSRPARLRKIALVGHLAGSNGDDERGFGELRVRAGRTCGYASLGSGANLTLVIPEREAPAIGGDPRRYLQAALRDFPEVEARVRRHDLERVVQLTGPFDRPVRRPWAPGAVLIGDAAGYYDPFTGQGVYQALRSARLAATAVEEALDDPAGESRALARYGRTLRRELAPTRALQRVIELAISRPRAFSMLARGLSRREEAAVRLLRATGDISHPGTLIDPLLWLRLLSAMAWDEYR